MDFPPWLFHHPGGRLEDAVHHLVFALDCFNHSPWTSAKHLTSPSPLTVQEILHNWQRVFRTEDVFTTGWWWETWTITWMSGVRNNHSEIHLYIRLFNYMGQFTPIHNWLIGPPWIYMRVEQKVLNRGLHCEGPGVYDYQSRLKFFPEMAKDFFYWLKIWRKFMYM